MSKASNSPKIVCKPVKKTSPEKNPMNLKFKGLSYGNEISKLNLAKLGSITKESTSVVLINDKLSLTRYEPETQRRRPRRRHIKKDLSDDEETQVNLINSSQYGNYFSKRNAFKFYMRNYQYYKRTLGKAFVKEYERLYHACNEFEMINRMKIEPFIGSAEYRYYEKRTITPKLKKPNSETKKGSGGGGGKIIKRRLTNNVNPVHEQSSVVACNPINKSDTIKEHAIQETSLAKESLPILTEEREISSTNIDTIENYDFEPEIVTKFESEFNLMHEIIHKSERLNNTNDGLTNSLITIQDILDKILHSIK